MKIEREIDFLYRGGKETLKKSFLEFTIGWNQKIILFCGDESDNTARTDQVRTECDKWIQQVETEY